MVNGAGADDGAAVALATSHLLFATSHLLFATSHLLFASVRVSVLSPSPLP